MTAGDLQQKHETESAEWQTRGTHGLVASVTRHHTRSR